MAPSPPCCPPERRLAPQRHPYQLRDTHGTPITPAQGQATVTVRYQIPAEIRDGSRSISRPEAQPGGTSGVEQRSETPLAPSMTLPPASDDA
jgi:hypothetical protein